MDTNDKSCMDESDDGDGIMFEKLPERNSKLIQKCSKLFGKLWIEAQEKRVMYYAKVVFWGIAALGYLVYFGFAMHLNPPFKKNSKGKDLFILTCIIFLALFCHSKLIEKGKRQFKRFAEKKGRQKMLNRCSWWIRLVFDFAVIIILIVFMIMERSDNWYQSLNEGWTIMGLEMKSKSFSRCFAVICFFVSNNIVLIVHPSNIGNFYYIDRSIRNFEESADGEIPVDPNIVVSSLIFEISLGIVIFKTKLGQSIVSYISDKVEKFLSSADAGAKTVYGSLYKFPTEFSIVGSVENHDIRISTDDSNWVSMAIQVTSSIIFLAGVISLCYHLGVMQKFINFLSSILKIAIGSSPTESIAVSANTLLGMTEVPLVVKPFLNHMTSSEMCVLMTAGMASVAGSVLGAYMKLDVPIEQLLGACVLVAPLSYLISKISHPENNVSKATSELVRVYRLDPEDSSMMKSILSGAVSALRICGAIIATLVATVALLTFADNIIEWFFSLVNLQSITFSVILGYVFYPLMWLIGIEKRDCAVAGKLFGRKTVMNEFLAFIDLGNIRKEREKLIQNGTFYNYVCGIKSYDKLEPMIFDERSMKIMVFAICGFANIASLGLLCSVLTTLAPQRTKTIQKNAIRSLICAIIANLLNAAFAGLMLPRSMYNETLSVREYCQSINPTK